MHGLVILNFDVLMTMVASARLTFLSEVDQNFSKAHVVGNGTLNSDTVMTDTILNIFPARFTKIATAGTEDITIFRETVNDSWIWHFVRGVKNLKISERSVNILDGKRLVAELDNIFLKKVFFKLSTSERKDDLSGRLALNTRNVRTVYSSIFQGIEDFICRHTVSGGGKKQLPILTATHFPGLARRLRANHYQADWVGQHQHI